MITGEVKNQIDSIWKAFWENGVTNPLTVAEQITYLFFINLLDINETKARKNAALLGVEPALQIFDAEHQDCRWSHLKNLEPGAMLAALRDRVFPWIKEGLPGGKDTAFARFMKDAILVIPSGKCLAKVVSVMENMDLDNKDMMGDVYEYLLSQISQSGKNGQFRTPRHIIRMMIELTDPTPEDSFCDPAMGSAGFLCGAAEYIKEKHPNTLFDPDVRAHFNTTMFSGFDTDITMLRIGAMNMTLHGVESPEISQQDSLSTENLHRDCYSLICANPPFKGNLDKSSIAKDLTAICPTTKTELLFLALFLRSLKVGGRCACIVPDGVLFGSSSAHKALRKALVEEHRLQAVISMPSGVFKPYAGVSTAVLLFTRTDHGGTDKVWFYDMHADGLSLDDKRSPVAENDIPDIIARFKNPAGEEDRARTEQSFFVPKSEIAANDYDLSINKYKQTEYTAVTYPPTSQLLAEIDALNAQIESETRALRELLGE